MNFSENNFNLNFTPSPYKGKMIFHISWKTRKTAQNEEEKMNFLGVVQFHPSAEWRKAIFLSLHPKHLSFANGWKVKWESIFVGLVQKKGPVGEISLLKFASLFSRVRPSLAIEIYLPTDTWVTWNVDLDIADRFL